MILIVEDNLELQRALQNFVRKLGYSCVGVSDGAEAAQRRIGNGIELILMDIGLPTVDGLAATKLIREFERTSGKAEVPIIAFTAGNAEREECLEAGMNDYLLKPVFFKDLANLLSKWNIPKHGS